MIVHLNLRERDCWTTTNEEAYRGSQTPKGRGRGIGKAVGHP